MHVVFGEQMPKSWAITQPERTSLWIAGPLILFSWVTRPFTNLLDWSSRRAGRFIGLKGTTSELERIHSPEEIRMLVEQSEKRGSLDSGDARLLEGVFEFSTKKARDVMTPRTEMIALPLTLTFEEAADRVALAGRSRYPVSGGPRRHRGDGACEGYLAGYAPARRDVAGDFAPGGVRARNA
jgi:CBS domain containing-hemolysin-like protein